VRSKSKSIVRSLVDSHSSTSEDELAEVECESCAELPPNRAITLRASPYRVG
jgi:hypothetical protein